MKIAFIGGRNIHKLGGIENYMYNLATELVKLGHEPIVFCESDHDGTEMCNGFKVIHQRSVGGKYLCKIILSYKATFKLIWNKENIDIFHYNAWPPSLASWLPRMFGKIAILQGHGLEWKRTKYSPTQQKIMKFMEWLTAKMNNHIIMVSQEQTDYFRKHYNKQCFTIPTATTCPRSNIQSEVLSKFNIPSKKYFLYLGRLVQDKNPDYLIKAYIKANIKDKYLVIAGSNDSMPEYVNYLHNLARGHNNIIFTGAVYGMDKEKLLEQCYVFCIPSTIEGLAITLLEAMSYGKICIASDIPANREGLGESGIWCKYENIEDLAEKIKYANDNYSKISWQENYNMKRIKENFTWSKISHLYDDYVKSLYKKK